MVSFRSSAAASLFRAGLIVATPLLLANPVLAKDVPKDGVAPAKEMSVGQSAARERQKKCGTEWRALSVSDKASQGPKWPQYYSKCVKRLKEQKA